MLDRRQDRLETAVDKLTSISADFSRLIAVHEQRIEQQEHDLDAMNNVSERRRIEIDAKFDALVEKMEVLRNENTSQCVEIIRKMGEMEKILWRYGGAAAVIAFVLAYGPAIIKFLENK